LTHNANHVAFLDTSVIVSKNFEKEDVKRRIEKKLSNLLKRTSTYVVMELKRRILRDLMYLHSILLEEKTVGDAQRRLAKISRSKRQLKMCLLIFAQISDISAKDRDEALIRLENMIRVGIRLYLHDIDVFESGTRCELAHRIPIKTDAGSYDFFPPWYCTRTIIQCRIDDFIKQNYPQLKSILNCLPRDPEWANYIKLLKKIYANPALARGNNCMVLGDTIIILDAPHDSGIYSTNKKDFGPICKCLNKEFNPV
jgi:hypothetical protein